MKSSYRMTPPARFALVVSVLVAALLLSGAGTASAAEASGDGSQTVLITGSNRGIGLAFAGFYARDPAWRKSLPTLRWTIPAFPSTWMVR